MNTKLIFLLSAVFAFFLFSCSREEHLINGIYHEDDKEGLRIFLKQQSEEKGTLNAELTGLDKEDVRSWYKSESWVEKLTGVTWNDEIPHRLIGFVAAYKEYSYYSVIFPSGTLDVSKWSELKSLTFGLHSVNQIDLSKNTKLDSLIFNYSQISSLNLSTNPELVFLHCMNNQLTELDLSKNTKLKHLACSYNKLTSLVVNPNLKWIWCNRNKLPLSDLFVFSEIISDEGDYFYKSLGPQNLSPRTVAIGEEIDYSNQSIFRDIQTQFIVKKGGMLTNASFHPSGTTSAPPDDYSLIEGKIKFNYAGTYWVFMTNEAITSRFDYPAEVFVQIIVM
jgi:hypothetical protein